jgi:hypothetical protein
MEQRKKPLPRKQHEEMLRRQYAILNPIFDKVPMDVSEALASGWKEPKASEFAEWHTQVNRECLRLSGCVGLDDIPVYDFASAFEAGEDPTDTARGALEEAGFPFDEEE